jgi:hypothetical protein
MAHYNSVMRLRRQPIAPTARAPETPASQTDEDRPSVLARPAFWIGGVLCVAAWAGIAKLFGWF